MNRPKCQYAILVSCVTLNYFISLQVVLGSLQIYILIIPQLNVLKVLIAPPLLYQLSPILLWRCATLKWEQHMWKRYFIWFNIIWLWQHSCFPKIIWCKFKERERERDVVVLEDDINWFIFVIFWGKHL